MKRKAGRVDRNDVKARAAAMRQKKAAAEAVQKAIVDVALHEKEGTSLSTYI